MLADGALEKDLMEVPVEARVFRAFFALIVGFLAIELVQTVYLTLARHDFYTSRAQVNISDEQVVLAPRGIIYDRNHEPLVENVASMDVFLAPRFLPAAPEERAQALASIADTLKIDRDTFAQKFAGKDWSVRARVALAENIPRDVAVDLLSRPIPGLSVVPSFRREHRTLFAFSHVIGYTGLTDEGDLARREELTVEDQVGRAGLEAYYDSTLRGVNGREVTFRDAQGNVREGQKIAAPTAGKDISTSIDGAFQEFFYGRLAQALRELNRTVGVGLAMDPQNGEILALVGIPSFDSNRIVDALNDAGEPFFNRAIAGLYNPGSTIKPLVATAALAEKVIDPAKQIFSKGYIEIPNPYHPESPSRFVDWKPNGWVNLADALAKSSNIYFYEVGGGFEDQVGLGIARLKEWWTRFGLGALTGVDLTGEEKGFLPDPAWKEETRGEPWRVGDTYNVAIGQGDFSVTPLALLNYVNAVANGGILYRPHIVLADTTSTVIADLQPLIGDALPFVREGMRQAVRAPYGTAHALAELPFPISAKTGTAQIEDNAKMNAFFVGFAPSEAPRLSLLILVENAVQGSLNTVPVARDVFMWYYNHRMRGNG